MTGSSPAFFLVVLAVFLALLVVELFAVMLLFVAFAFVEVVLDFAVVVFLPETVAVLLEREAVARFEAVVVDSLFAFVVGLLLLDTFEGVIFRPLVLLVAVAFGEFFSLVLFRVAFLADAVLVVLVDLVVFEGLVLATDNLI